MRYEYKHIHIHIMSHSGLEQKHKFPNAETIKLTQMQQS